MAFKTSTGNGGLILDENASWINGYDGTTVPSNEVKIKASDGAEFDRFGYSVSVGSGRIVVGSNLDDDNGTDSGSAYIYDLDGNQLSKIKASDAAASDTFGYSVAVGSGRIVVGARYDDDNGSNSGSAYIYDLDGNQLSKIKASDGAEFDQFGYSVAVGSGRIVVGAYGDDDNGSSSGSAYIFDLDGNQLGKIKPSDGVAYDNFGSSVAVGSGRICVGSYADDDNGTSSGSAYIFDLDGNQLAKIKASDGGAYDKFGRGQSVSVGSGRICVGSYYDDDNGSASGSAYIFDLDGNQLAKIKSSDAVSNDYFGYSVSVGSGRIVVGSYADDDDGAASGSAYIFDLDGNQLAKIKASDAAASDWFGSSVAVGSGRIVVGAYGDDDNGTVSGSAYIYDLDGNQLHKITASDGVAEDRFGWSVSVGSGRICVGAYRNDDNGSNSGSAYIFDLDGNQLAKIKASDGVALDTFAYSVSVGSGSIVVGASGDGDNGSLSGSAYIYDTPKNTHILDILD